MKKAIVPTAELLAIIDKAAELDRMIKDYNEKTEWEDGMIINVSMPQTCESGEIHLTFPLEHSTLRVSAEYDVMSRTISGISVFALVDKEESQ